jgi:hypothetical protein
LVKQKKASHACIAVLVRTENEIETAMRRFVVVGDKLAPPTQASINGGTAAAAS